MFQRVYVPVAGHPAVADVLPGSGIVGAPEGGHVLIDFEGNRNGASNIVTFADRVHHAAGRAATRYPTVARRLVPREAVSEVGGYDEDEGVVVLDGPDAAETLAAWLGVAALDEAQLRSTGAHHERRREAQAAMRSLNPALRLWARREAARIGLDSAVG